MKQDIEYAVPLFKAGAEWRINSVWHDAREKPDKGKLLIVEDIDGAYDLVYSTKSKPWEELSEKNHYMRWAYNNDLVGIFERYKDIADGDMEVAMNFIKEAYPFNEETESFIRKKFDMPMPDESKE